MTKYPASDTSKGKNLTKLFRVHYNQVIAKTLQGSYATLRI